jgi:drug/metabolite transporter (DMT)-like permease
MPVNRIALFLALLSTVFWAGSQVASSIVLDSFAPALYVILIELFFILFGAIYVLFNGRAAAVFLRAVRSHREIRGLIFACAVSIFVYEVSFYFALSYSAKLITIVITSLWPLFTIFWGKQLQIASWKTLGLREFLLAFIAFSGAALVIADHFHFAWGQLVAPQILCALVAAVSGGFWDASVNKVIDREREFAKGDEAGAAPRRLSNANIVVFSILLARSLLIPVFAAWFFLGHVPVSIEKNLLVTAATITFFGYVVSDVIFSLAISFSGAALVSVSYLVPLLVTLLFKMFYSQNVSAVTLVGLYLVFFANFMLHTKQLRLSPATGATIFFILIVSGAFVIDPNSVKQFVGADKSSDTVMQLAMTALALALGFLLQQADARNRDEKAYLVNLFNCLSEMAKSTPQGANLVSSPDIYGTILALRRTADPISVAFEKTPELIKYFGLKETEPGSPASDNEARIQLAFEQWYQARKSIDNTKDSWFLGALVFAIGLSIVVTSVATPFLILLSGIGASLLCYLWILLNGSLLPEDIKSLEMQG